MRAAALLAWAAAAGAACTSGSGTILVSLTVAPGSTVLDTATTLRVTVTDPPSVTLAARGGDGSFDAAIAFDAIQAEGVIIVEGLDAGSAVVAVGESPPFPLAAVNAKLVIYLAAPDSFASAPLSLDAGRTGITVVPVAFGGVLAGGRDAAGSASAELRVYNAFDHTIASGLPLAATGSDGAGSQPRSDMAGAAGTSGLVYFFGGTDGSGAATGTLWRFNPTTAPAGSYEDLGPHAELARAGQTMLLDGTETFVITGSPALDLDGETKALTTRRDLAAAPAEAARTLGTDGTPIAIFAGAAGVSRLRAGVVDMLTVAGGARTDHAVVGLAGGQVAILGGSDAGTPTRAGILLDAAAGTATTVTAALSSVRLHPAVAATARYVVVAGGTDETGAVVSTADILDAATLQPRFTKPLVVPRTRATALALPNEQVLIVGGLDANGQPTAVLELFTPDAPPSRAP